MKTGSSTQKTLGQTQSRKELQEGRLKKDLTNVHRVGYFFLTMLVLSVITAVLVPTLYSGKVPGIDFDICPFVVSIAAGVVVGVYSSIGISALSVTQERHQEGLNYALRSAIGRNENITEWLHRGAQDNLESAIRSKKHMQEMLEDGAVLTPEEGVRLLHLAIRYNAETVDLLLERVDPHAPNKDGNNALHMAAMACPSRIPSLLPKMNKCDQTNHKGETPLMLAANTGSLEGVQALIARGVDVNAKTLFGHTPLMKAAYASCKNNKIIELLVEKGARINDQDFDGKRALHYAVGQVIVARGISNVQALLQARAQLDVQDILGRTPLYIVSEESSDYEGYEKYVLQTVELLVKNGCNINLADKNGRTPIQNLKGATTLRYMVDKGGLRGLPTPST